MSEGLGTADKHIAKRIMDKLESAIVDNPVPHDAKTIVGEHGVFHHQKKLGILNALPNVYKRYLVSKEK